MGFWEPLFFWIFAVGAVGTSVGVLLFRNPLYSALSLVVDFFFFAGLYVLLSAHFLAVIQVLVYAGAIMVLFIFIIMLLNLSDEELGARQFSLHHVLAIIAGGVVFAASVVSINSVVDFEKVDDFKKQAAQSEGVEATQIQVPSRVPGLYAMLSERAAHEHYEQALTNWERGVTKPSDGKYRTFDPNKRFEMPPVLSKQVRDDRKNYERREPDEGLFGTVEPISISLVNRFVIPFELTALLLLGALFGAVVIAKKRL